MVAKMAGPSGRSATSLSKEVNVSQATLSRWFAQAKFDVQVVEAVLVVVEAALAVGAVEVGSGDAVAHRAVAKDGQVEAGAVPRDEPRRGRARLTVSPVLRLTRRCRRCADRLSAVPGSARRRAVGKVIAALGEAAGSGGGVNATRSFQSDRGR